MRKKVDPIFGIGDIVRVVMPTMAVNLKTNEDEKKFDVEEVILVGDEGLIVTEVEYLEKQREYLYKVTTDSVIGTTMFSIPEEQLTLF